MKSKTMKFRIGKYIVEHLRIPRRNKAGDILHYSPYIKNKNMIGKPIMRRIKNLDEFHRYFDRYSQTAENELIQKNTISYHQPQQPNLDMNINPNDMPNNDIDNQNDDGLNDNSNPYDN